MSSYLYRILLFVVQRVCAPAKHCCLYLGCLDRSPYVRCRNLLFALASMLFLLPAAANAQDPVEPPPVAVAQAIGTLEVGSALVLDASSSVSPSGLPLTYAWRIVSTPAASTATLDNDASVRPSLQIDVEGQYEIELIVTAEDVASTPYIFQVSTDNNAADAKIVAYRDPSNGVFVLDASQTTDRDGDRLTYAWSVTSAPDGSAATLDNASAQLTTFMPDIDGDYVFSLVVTDAANAASVTQAVALSTSSSAPTADAGEDRTVAVNVPVTFDPSKSTDVDGDVLVSSWSILSAPDGSAVALTAPDLGRVTLVPDVPGDYVVQLTVQDETQVDHDSVVVSVGTAQSSLPVAKISRSSPVAVGTVAQLDATRSFDPDGDLVAFQWNILSTPNGSAATIVDSNSARASLVPDAEGEYVVQVSVRDETGLVAFSTTTISTSNGVPIANAGLDQVLSSDGTATVDGSASQHTAGEPITQNWSVLGLTASGDPETGTFTDATALTTDVNFPLPPVSVPKAAEYLQNNQAIILRDLKSRSSIVGPTVVGRSFYGKSATFSGWANAAVDGDILTVAKYLKAKWVEVNGPGNVRVGGKLWGEIQLNNNAQIIQDPDLDLGSLGMDLRTWSHELCLLPDSGTVEIQGDTVTLTANPDAQGLAVIHVRDGRRIFGGGHHHRHKWGWGRRRHGHGHGHGHRPKKIEIELNGAKALIINVGGAAINVKHAKFVGASTGADVISKVLWNFYETRALRVDRSFYGSILAPYANTKNTAPIYGSVALRRLDHRAPISGGGFSGGSAFGQQQRPVDAAVLQLAVRDGARISVDTVLVSKGNLAPVARIDGSDEVDVDTAVPLNSSGSADANGDALTTRWALIHRPEGSQTALSSSTDAQVSFTPDKRGLYIVQLAVSDGTLESSYTTKAIFARNRLPVITSTPVTTGRTGEAYAYALTATDPDGDNVAFSLVEAPDGMSLSGNEISWTPENVGSYTVTVRANDGFGGVVDQTFEVVVEPGGNRPPVLSAVGDQVVALGQTLRFVVSATDPNGDAVTYSAFPLPAGASLDDKTGSFSFRPVSATPETFEVTVVASDGSDRAEETITISVQSGDVNEPARLSGRVLDANDIANGTITPVAQATVQIGAQSVETDVDGRFSLDGVTPGPVQLSITKTGYLAATLTETAFAGSLTTVEPDVALARVTGNGIPVDPASPTLVSNPDVSGVSGTVDAGGVQNPDGTPYTGTLNVVDVPPSSAPLPETINACSVQAISSSAPVVFNPPMQLTLPNRDNLPAGTGVMIWAYDTSVGTFVRSGTGVVSADAQSITTASGGLTTATSFVAVPIELASEESPDQPREGWVPSVLGEGNVRTFANVSGHSSVGRQRGSALIYNSTTANPRPIISSVVSIPAERALPGTVETQLYVSGVRVSNPLITNLATPADPNGTPINDDADERISQQITFDASWLPTGYHDYRLLTFAKYGCNAVASERTGRVFVNNLTQSPYGRGWRPTDIQTLHIEPDGSALIEEASGALSFFEKKKAVEDFNRKSLRFDVEGGAFPVAEDFDSDGHIDFAFMNSGTGVAQVYINRGNDNFERKEDIPFSDPKNIPPLPASFSPNVSDMTVGDINQDGIPDLIVSKQVASGATGERGVDIAYGNGDGSFRTPVSISEISSQSVQTVRTADINADGIPDFVVIEGGSLRRIVAYFGAEDGTYQSVSVKSGITASVRLVLPDLDNDGDPEVVSNSRWDGGIYANDAFDDFSSSGPSPYTFLNQNIQAGDLDGDGRLEVAFLSSQGKVAFASFQPDSSFNATKIAVVNKREALIDASFGQPTSLSLFDIDGDGDLDFLLSKQQSPGSVGVLKNDGNGNFSAIEELPIAHSLDTTRFVDFDGDGAVDLLTVNRFEAFVDFSTPKDGRFVGPLPDFTSFEQLADGTYVRTYKDGSTVAFNAQGQMTSRVDTNGNTTSYEYDAEGRLAKVTDPAGLETVYAYANGRIASITEPSGKVLEFGLSLQGGIELITKADDAERGFSYNDHGVLESETDEDGNTTSYTTDAADRLARVDLPDGATVRLEIANAIGVQDLSGPEPGPQNFVRPEDRFSVVTDPRGNTIAAELNEWGGLLRSKDQLDRVTLYARNEQNLVTLISRPSSVAPAPTVTGGGQLASGLSFTLKSLRDLAKKNSLVAKTSIERTVPDQPDHGLVRTSFEYDREGNVTSMTEAVGTELERTTTYEYEPTRNRIVRKVDPDITTRKAGAVLTWEYDANGNITKATDALGFFKAYTYDARGLTLTETDERGNTTTYAYDQFGRQESMTTALGYITQYQRDVSGNITTMIEAVGLPEQRAMQYTYDPLNRRTSMTDGEGNVTNYSYDRRGNVVRMEDATGVVTTGEYDSRNRLAASVDPTVGRTEYSYDGLSNLIKVKDPAGVETTFEYDDVNRQVAFIDGLNFRRSRTYDLRDNVISHGDALGNTTNYTHDILDRTLTRSDSAGSTWTWEYDIRDLKITATKPSGNAITFEYDLKQQMTELSWGRNTDQYGYAYDGYGNIIEGKQLGNVEIRTYAYDAQNRLTRETWTDNRNLRDFDGHFIERAYDALNRVRSIVDRIGATHTYAYDRADRLVGVTAPSGKKTDITVDAADRPIQVNYPSGLQSQIAYDVGAGTANTGRVLSITRGLDIFGAGGGPLNQLLGTFNYNYTARGNIAQISEPRRTRSFTYDALERLTQVDEPRPSPDPAVNLESYTLDGQGNRVASHKSQFHITNPANRLQEDEQHVYEYDVDGNLITKTIKASGKVWRYTHDRLDRLSVAALFATAADTDYETQVTYKYDAFSRRVFREQLSGLSRDAERQYYLHQDWEIDLVEEWRRTQTSGFTRARRVWFTKGGVDDLFAMTEWDPSTLSPSTASFYYSADHLGSIRALHDDAGAVVADYDTDTYGNPEVAVETVKQPFRFTGREYDRATGLYHYRAREYDANTGRFIQEDPIFFNSGDLNNYRYVWNNPMAWTDPSGMAVGIEYGCLAVFAVGAGTTAGVTAGVGSAGIFATGASILAAAAGDAELISSIQGANAASSGAATAFGAVVAEALSNTRCGRARTQHEGRGSISGGGAGGGVGGAGKCGPSKRGRNSFAAGTLIATGDGLKKIEDVRVGDFVKAIDPATGVVSLKRVLGRSERVATAGVVRVTMRDAEGREETVIVTANHPYLRAANDNDGDFLNLVALDPGGDWTAAGLFEVGDKVQAGISETLEVVKVEKVDLSQLSEISVGSHRPNGRDSGVVNGGKLRVYNFEIADNHTYAVGELEAWVHNGFGAYLIIRPDGKMYVGKGDINRARTSARQKGGRVSKFFKARCNRSSFILEDMIIERFGGVAKDNKGNDDIKLLNIINSPGKKYRGRR